MFHVLPVCLESDSKPLVQFTALNIRIYFTIFQNVLEIFSYCLSHAPRVTNTLFIACLKSYQLNEPTGSNQLYFSDEILSLHAFTEVYTIMLHIVAAAVLAAFNNLTAVPEHTPSNTHFYSYCCVSY
jgi:hypothetical protein